MTLWRRYKEAEILFRAGANAITKFPATKLFGTEQAETIEQGARKAGRTFKGTLTKLPNIDWDKEVEGLDFDPKLKEQLKEKLRLYLNSIENNINNR